MLPKIDPAKGFPTKPPHAGRPIAECARCGKTIYAYAGPWWAITDPPPVPSCNCFRSADYPMEREG